MNSRLCVYRIVLFMDTSTTSPIFIILKNNGDEIGAIIMLWSICRLRSLKLIARLLQRMFDHRAANWPSINPARGLGWGLGQSPSQKRIFFAFWGRTLHLVVTFLAILCCFLVPANGWFDQIYWTLIGYGSEPILDQSTSVLRMSPEHNKLDYTPARVWLLTSLQRTGISCTRRGHSGKVVQPSGRYIQQDSADGTCSEKSSPSRFTSCSCFFTNAFSACPVLTFCTVGYLCSSFLHITAQIWTYLLLFLMHSRHGP